MAIIDTLTPLVEPVFPENIVYQNEAKYLGHLSFSLSELNKPKIGIKKMYPLEYAYASTKNLPNGTYIIMQRYPMLPYWNRYYSNRYIEDMSMFAYTKTGAHHVYRCYNNVIAHFMVEDVADEFNGYKLVHPVVAFTY